MTSSAYDTRSPYYDTPTTDKYVNYLEFWQPRTIPVDPNDIIVKLESKHKNRPDLLAHELYGSPQLWWIFALRNPDVIKDPIYDFVPDTVIYAPASSNIKRYM